MFQIHLRFVIHVSFKFKVCFSTVILYRHSIVLLQGAWHYTWPQNIPYNKLTTHLNFIRIDFWKCTKLVCSCLLNGLDRFQLKVKLNVHKSKLATHLLAPYLWSTKVQYIFLAQSMAMCPCTYINAQKSIIIQRFTLKVIWMSKKHIFWPKYSLKIREIKIFSTKLLSYWYDF